MRFNLRLHGRTASGQECQADVSVYARSKKQLLEERQGRGNRGLAGQGGTLRSDLRGSPYPRRARRETLTCPIFLGLRPGLAGSAVEQRIDHLLPHALAGQESEVVQPRSRGASGAGKRGAGNGNGQVALGHLRRHLQAVQPSTAPDCGGKGPRPGKHGLLPYPLPS